LTDSNDPEAWTQAVSQSRKPVELTGEEKESFLNERKNFTFSSTGGVTIKVGFSDELYQNVKDQFDPLKVAISSERLDHILGTYDMETYLLDELVDDSSPKKLELYKPFDQPMNEYHRFVEYRILYNKTFGFWYLVPLLSTTITERGFSFPKAQKLGKKNTFVNTEEEKEENEFEFTFRTTLPTYMDESKVYTRTDQHGIEHSSMWWDSGATEVLTKYEAKYKFFEANTTENRWGMQFIRNSQFIKIIPLELETRLRQVTSNFRAFRVRSALLYKIISKQDNPMDSKMGIQFNKNQYNSENFPSDLKEFLRRIQMKHALEWRKELVERQKNPDPQNPPQEELEIKTPSTPTTTTQEELEIKTPPAPTTTTQEELEIKTPPAPTTTTQEELNSDHEMLTRVKKLVSSLNFEMDEAEFLATKILNLIKNFESSRNLI